MEQEAGSEGSAEISHACTWGMDQTGPPGFLQGSNPLLLFWAELRVVPAGAGVVSGWEQHRCTLSLSTCTLSVTPHQLSSGEGGIPARPQVGLLQASSCLDHLEVKLLKAPELGV